MNNILNIKTPAQSEAGALQSDYGSENHGLTNLNTVYWNLPTEALYEELTFRREGIISHQGPVIVKSILSNIGSCFLGDDNFFNFSFDLKPSDAF